MIPFSSFRGSPVNARPSTFLGSSPGRSFGRRVAGSAEKEAVAAAVCCSVFVEVRLVVRTPTIQGIQVKPRCPEILCRVRVILLLQRAVRIERQIVVDKLPKVGIPRRNSRVFVCRAQGSHRLCRATYRRLGAASESFLKTTSGPSRTGSTGGVVVSPGVRKSAVSRWMITFASSFRSTHCRFRLAASETFVQISSPQGSTCLRFGDHVRRHDFWSFLISFIVVLHGFAYKFAVASEPATLGPCAQTAPKPRL